MRKLIYAINMTVDSCCDHTKMIAGEDVHQYHTDLLKTADTMVYGRKTFELMVPYWPDVARNNSGGTKAETDFAQAFDAIGKIVVFSRSLGDVKEKKISIVQGNPSDEILKLKQEQGKNIVVGGVDIPTQLIALGLVDEFHFVIQPMIAASGRRLTDDFSLPDLAKLKFVDSVTLTSGSVALRYLIN